MLNIDEKIIKAVFSSYILIYEIDIRKDYIRVIYDEEQDGTLGMVAEGNYTEFNKRYSRERVDKEYARERERRGSINNLKQELLNKTSFEISYPVVGDKVRTVEYRKIAEEIDGTPSKVFMAYKRLEDDRAETFRLKQERQKHKELLEVKLNEAKEASNAKNRFLSNMSHDLRTPISSMKGYINLAKTHIDNKELVSDYLNKIDSNCNQLIGIINDVLDISKIESGKINVEEYQQSLYDIVEEIKNIISPLASSKKQDLVIKINVKDEQILADKIKVIKVISNILNNSVKYTHRCGKIKFTINPWKTKKGGYIGYIFEIEDNGVGISENFLEHVFEPFERENDREIAKIQGTGLGLSIARELVKLLGGELVIESEKYKGTKVRIKLEFKLFRQDILANKVEYISNNNLRRAEDIANQRTFEKKKFLIVDDNEANLEILSTFLEDLGASTDTVSNGYDALNIIKNSKAFQYNAVLMDIKMPVLNGDETTKEVRKLENRTVAAIPIIGISANVYSKDRMLAFDAGMDAYLAKPFDTSELIRILKEVML